MHARWVPVLISGMSNLDDLVNIKISASTATPTKPGFGVILIAAQNCPVSMGNRTRLFSSLTEMLDAGFPVTHPAYLCAQKMKAQNPAIRNFKIGKRLNKTSQTIELTCLSSTEGDVYYLKLRGIAYSFTVGAASSTATVSLALAGLIDPDSVVSATSSSATVTITAAAGVLFDVSEWSSNMTLKNTSVDPGLAADLEAINGFDTQWYGLALDSQSEDEINAAALFTETAKKLFVANSSDYGCENPSVSTDVMSDMKSAAYARTGILYSRSSLLSYSGAAWMAKQFTQNPGSDTWMYKSLAGVTVDNITSGARAAILAKNGNCYTSTSGINMTEPGKSGAGEYIDVTRFVDWLRAEIQFRVFSSLVNNSKIPYTDEGVDLIQSIIAGALKTGIERGGLVKGTTSVTFPLVADIDPATRATRKLADGKFSGRLAGAVHELDLSGSLTP